MDPTPNTTIKTFPSIEKIQIKLRQTAKNLSVSLDRHTFSSRVRIRLSKRKVFELVLKVSRPVLQQHH